jgi:lysyl-tRNA synthetase, class II
VRRLVPPPLTILLCAAATGWLYLYEPAIPGPRIGEALPLDALSRHDGVPLVWFVAVWGAAAIILALAARWAHYERVSAALLLSLVVGLFVYVETALSTAVVQQVALGDALDAATRMKAVYLPALLVGAATALIVRGRGARPAAPIVALAVAAAGALDLLHAVLPGTDSGILRPLTPDAAGSLARAAGALAAIALLAASRGLARRRHRAWQVAIAVAGLSTVLHVLHGLNDGTLASAVVFVLLIARRDDFDRPGDTATRRAALVRLATVVCTLLVYGTAATWLNRLAADRPFSLSFALRELGRGVLGLDVGGSPPFTGAFAGWFPLSLLLIGAAGLLWIVEGWLAPWGHRVSCLERERELARDLVHEWGADTLAPFVLRADKSYFFSEDETAFLAYRVVGGVAIVSGDPIGPPNQGSGLIGRFAAYARRRDWRIAILGASEQWLPVYAAHGLRSLYHGDEAIVRTDSFSLNGRPIRKVRQSVHRLSAAGYEAVVLRPSDIAPALRERLEAVAHEWRGKAPERGFVMALDALFGLGDEDAIFVVGFDAGGSPAGFLHFAISSAGHALSLSSMPRLRDTPNGFNEWLICSSIEWARSCGYERVSLNFSPFAALLDGQADLTLVQEMQKRALLSVKGHFQLDNLLLFNRKFFPSWERRFIVYEHRRDLPRVGLAALAAEAYLPFQAARR